MASAGMIQSIAADLCHISELFLKLLLVQELFASKACSHNNSHEQQYALSSSAVHN